jgi:hypothetical protein
MDGHDGCTDPRGSVMARQSDDLKNPRQENADAKTGRADLPAQDVPIHDAGPAAPTTFGGEVTTATDRISQAGIPMAPMCAPTRQGK